MARPSRIVEQRERLIPVVAKAFSDLGYHRATTAQIARRCKVRENILYRLWADKKAMFLASIRHVYDLSIRTWQTLGTGLDGKFSFLDALDYEARHIGEFGNYRVLFAALGEPDDPEIRETLSGVYAGFHDFLRGRLRGMPPELRPRDPDLVAWALIALGTVSTITKELRLATPGNRRRLLATLGRSLLKT